MPKDHPSTSQNDGSYPGTTARFVTAERLASIYRHYSEDSAKELVALRERHLIATVEEFLGLYHVIRSEHPHTSEETGFERCVAFVLEHWDSFFDIAVDPTFICWVSLLRDLIEPYGHRATAAADLRDHISASGLDRESYLHQHLTQFAAFAAGTAVKTGSDFVPPQTLSLQDGWLPGTDTELARDGDGNGKEVLQAVLGGIPCFKSAARPHPVPRARAASASLLVHANHPYYHLKHVERWPRLMTQSARVAFASRLAEAMSLTDQLIPGICRETDVVLNTCVAMETKGVTPMASGSYTRLFGAIFLADSPQVEFMAEMFIHEFCHNKLTLLEDAAPFFRNFSRRRFHHYSPWRDTLRSAEGVLHALFVHAEIARFWIRLLEQGSAGVRKDVILRRVWTLLGQLDLGAEDLRRTGEFTEVGSLLLDDIAQSIAEWRAAVTPCSPSAHPLFSEMKKDPELLELSIARALVRHRTAVWTSSAAS
jgi:HEXXH motif-containing protein